MGHSRGLYNHNDCGRCTPFTNDMLQSLVWHCWCEVANRFLSAHCQAAVDRLSKPVCSDMPPHVVQPRQPRCTSSPESNAAMVGAWSTRLRTSSTTPRSWSAIVTIGLTFGIAGLLVRF